MILWNRPHWSAGCASFRQPGLPPPADRAGAVGIGVIFEKENINTLTESSEFLITLFSSFSQAESESMGLNIVMGMRQSMKEGKIPFQYSRTLGYRRGPDGRPEIDRSEAETVRLICARYLEDRSLGEIQKELTERESPTAEGIQGWSRQVIQNILTSEKYIGDGLRQKTHRLAVRLPAGVRHEILPQ